jgi:hypothetical protein
VNVIKAVLKGRGFKPKFSINRACRIRQLRWYHIHTS